MVNRRQNASKDLFQIRAGSKCGGGVCLKIGNAKHAVFFIDENRDAVNDGKRGLTADCPARDSVLLNRDGALANRTGEVSLKFF